MEINYEHFVELVKNCNDSAKIKKLYNELICNKLTGEYNIHIYINGEYFECDVLNLQIHQNKVKNYAELKEKIQAKIGNNLEKIQLKEKFYYFFSNIKIEKKYILNCYKYSYSFDNASFFELLNYIKTNKYNCRTIEYGYKLMDKIQDYSNHNPDREDCYFYPTNFLRYQKRYNKWLDLELVCEDFKGLFVKFFQNGKVHIKGLTDLEWQKIKEIYNLKINNINN